jgi:prefoldin subunit 5
MDFILGKKKPSSSHDEHLRQLSRQVEFLKRENSELRLQLDDNRQASHTNKLLIDQLIKLISNYQSTTEALERRLEEVESLAAENKQAIGSLESQKDEDSEDLVIFEDALAMSQVV